REAHPVGAFEGSHMLRLHALGLHARDANARDGRRCIHEETSLSLPMTRRATFRADFLDGTRSSRLPKTPRLRVMVLAPARHPSSECCFWDSPEQPMPSVLASYASAARPVNRARTLRTLEAGFFLADRTCEDWDNPGLNSRVRRGARARLRT